MEKVRIGLIGCGLFGECHAQIFQQLRTAQVEAVFDIDGKRGAEVASRYGIPRICASVEEICSLPGLDAIDVVTAEDQHLEPALCALAAGRHLFVEKPLATRLEDCERMIAAAEKADRFLMVGHVLRFETKYLLLKEEVESGRLGRIASMHARRNRPSSLLPRYGRTHPALENCVHDIDLMLWYAGDRVERVRGYGRRFVNERHPDVFWGMLEFAGGAVGVVETIWLLPEGAGIGLDDAFQLVGDAGVGNVRLVPEGVSFWEAEGYRAPDYSYYPELSGPVRGALRDELAYFCDCVLDDRAPASIEPRAGMEAVRVALGLIESAQTGKEIAL